MWEHSSSYNGVHSQGLRHALLHEEHKKCVDYGKMVPGSLPSVATRGDTPLRNKMIRAKKWPDP